MAGGSTKKEAAYIDKRMNAVWVLSCLICLICCCIILYFWRENHDPLCGWIEIKSEGFYPLKLLVVYFIGSYYCVLKGNL